MLPLVVSINSVCEFNYYRLCQIVFEVELNSSLMNFLILAIVSSIDAPFSPVILYGSKINIQLNIMYPAVPEEKRGIRILFR